MIGAALFFKDLTYVEQMEERERLRDRLAAVGEMAAVMAHEIKNPLAGIEVLAGLVRRKTPDNAEAQALVERHHQRSEDGQRHRPGSAGRSCGRCGCRSSAPSCATRWRSAVTLADGKAPRGGIQVRRRRAAGLPPHPRRPAPADAGVRAT